MISPKNLILYRELMAKFAPLPCAIAFIEREDTRESREQRFIVERTRNETALRSALQEIFGQAGFPENYANDSVLWRHDGWGRPFVKWRGEVADWAKTREREDRFFHVSNTHDGAAHLVLAAYGENLAGVGIDAVHLPRLRRAEKGRDYLLRFAGQFMSEAEYADFSESGAQDSNENLVLRTAAHFSLMEAASKACGTGLKIGFGMGKDYSLPKRSIEIRHLSPETEIAFSGAARERLDALGAAECRADWTLDGDYLVSVVLLLKNQRGNVG